MIVQQVLLGPAALEAAVRVTEAWDQTESGLRSAGFTYVALQGHPECGISTFQVRLENDHCLVVVIDVRSLPGTEFTRLVRPVARLFQRAITRAALKRLTRAAVDSAIMSEVKQGGERD